eukprot:gb/GECH01007767.1/.p1 GENE.gb/GECH01007767.1/~~gb/GECH01007767.1/.p1  ORF type:complete len:739 (+),score=191.86 gb/GECH01007767.1/:1-2217(+)
MTSLNDSLSLKNSFPNGGFVYGWGFGGFGSLAIGSVKTQRIPVQINFTRKNISKVAGHLWHAGYITEDGELYTVGRGRYGALGTGFELDQLLYPHQVKSFQKAKIIDVACGISHTLCLTDQGKVYSFGFGHACGHCTTTLEGFPREVDALKGINVIAVYAGEKHSACLTHDARVYSWGLHTLGPVEIPFPEPIAKLSLGNKHILALSNSGNIYVKLKTKPDGDYKQRGPVKKEFNSGTLNAITLLPLPDRINNINEDSNMKWIDIAAGSRHSIALNNHGEVYVWGSIYMTEKTRGIQKTPKMVPINGSPQIVKIHCGLSHFLALSNDGQLFSWGYNEHHNTGTGQESNAILEPTPVAIDDQVKTIFAGGHNTWAICGNASAQDLKCLFESMDYSDISLLPNDNDEFQLKAHRGILSARSPVIKELIIQNPTATCITLTQVPLKYLKAILEYIYTGNINTELSSISTSEYSDFVSIAQKLGLSINTKENKNELVFPPQVNLTRELRSILDNKDAFPDVEFVLDDETRISAHKSILLHRVQWFRAMFVSGMMESVSKQISFPDVSTEAFKIFLGYVYDPAEQEIPLENVVEVLEIAARTNWSRLRGQCEQIITENLDEANLFQMVEVAEYCTSTAIHAACIRKLANQYDDIKDSTEFIQLDSSVKNQVEEQWKKIRNLYSEQEKRLEQEIEHAKLMEQEEEEQLERGQALDLARPTTQEDFYTIDNIIHRRERNRNCIVQ